MSDGITAAEVRRALAISQSYFEAFHDRVSAILATDNPLDYEFELVRALLAAKRIIGATSAFERVERTSKKPPRGLGYTQDEAMIIASLPWHDDNLSAAIRAHYRNAGPEEVQVHARRIRERRREIEEFEGVLPWEVSRNWLGDLTGE